MIKEPKDLGIKIGTKEGVIWKGIKDKAEKSLLNYKVEIEINEMILKFAKSKIKEEKKASNTGVY